MRRSVVLLSLAAVLLAVGFFGVRSRTLAADAVINPTVLTQLEQGRADFFVKMANDIDTSDAVAVEGREARLNYVYETLSSFAAADQAEIQAFLDKQGVEYVSFWINNSIFVKDGDLALARALVQRSDVAYLRANDQVPLHRPVEVGAVDSGDNGTDAVEWGVQRINADDVWALGYTGQGITVANIDSGVRYTHTALRGNYRGAVDGTHDYNWWDPGLYWQFPHDNGTHGTHVMGTIVGDDGGANQIGVAPGATWIAAQGCGSFFCSNFDLTSSAQWVLCPTKRDGTMPNCSKAPHVVNNSWGGGGGDPWYTTYVNQWVNAGIAPIFSAGNSGSGCNTLGSPGDYKFSVSVGASDINNRLAGFSSRGPSVYRSPQPDITAPGDNVRSSRADFDTAYGNLSGTSMASPHTAGAMALLMSKNDTLPLLDYYRAITLNAQTSGLLDPGAGNNCGGTAWNDFTPANNVYGYGLLDALAAINAIP